MSPAQQSVGEISVADVVPLREHLEALIDNLDKRLSGAIDDRDARIQLALAASKEAVLKAETANDKRLELLNEFRGQSADRDARFALTDVMDQKFTTYDEKIGRNTSDIASLQGRLIAFTGLGALFGGSITALIVKLTGG